ncbi:MAG: class I SAM-dependent methyltransferase [Flavobacteriaceae bacterium]|nr:class I SAM-dependent methyltransferase [Flavobacteriaceae bacterium]
MSSILDFNTSINSDFLHANGESGTDLLIDKLNIQGSEKIVEFGVGTGGTLIKLKSKYPTIHLTGIDASHKMLEAARKRIKFCGLKNQIELIHSNDKNTIQENSIDIVYIESVLGILNQKTLKEVLFFLNKILKDQGTLVINESIWLDSVSEKEIDFINEKCKKLFGIRQCNIEFKTIDDTIKYFHDLGFKNQSCKRIRKTDTNIKRGKTITELRSKVFTSFGKLKLLYSLKLKNQEKKYNAEMTTIFEEEKEYLTGVIMVFKNSNYL